MASTMTDTDTPLLDDDHDESLEDGVTDAVEDDGQLRAGGGRGLSPVR